MTGDPALAASLGAAASSRRHGLGHVHVQLGRAALGDQRVAVAQLHALAVALDRELRSSGGGARSETSGVAATSSATSPQV